LSPVCRRGPAGAIVVRAGHGRTACRGHHPHHDHQGRTGGRLVATIAANERYRSPSGRLRPHRWSRQAPITEAA